jgi:uncharacterized protein
MKTVDIVVITSKLCNLRCRYCYELPLLSDKTRMSLEQLERAFSNFYAFFRTLGEEATIRFCWHGGEPLLIAPDYYWQAFELQRKIFGGSIHKVMNHVQTNLTVIDDARFDLLKNGFQQVGVSLDVVGGLRVNAAGKDQEHKTRENLEYVLEAGLKPSGITVLNRFNMYRIADVYGFYRDRGMSFRLLPLEPGLYEAGQPFEITPREILGTLCKVADLWFQEAPALRIEPIHSLLDALVGTAGHSGIVVPSYDPSAWQWVVLLDTNGQLLGYTDGFDGANSPGNIFDTGFDVILQSPVNQRRAEHAKSSISKSCGDCAYYRSRCNGHHIAEGGATMHEALPDGALRCVVAQGLFQHLEMRLLQAGVLEAPGVLSTSYRQTARLGSPASVA